MKPSNVIENLTVPELKQLIEDLQESIRLQPADDIDWSGSRGVYEATLEKAEARLRELTDGAG